MSRSISFHLAGVLSAAFLLGSGDSIAGGSKDNRGEQSAANTMPAAKTPAECPIPQGTTATRPAPETPAPADTPTLTDVYCRKLPANETETTKALTWQLFPLSASDLAWPDADFVIVDDFKPEPQQAGLTIDRCDRMRIEKKNGVFTLTHIDSAGLLKGFVANLKIEEDNKLWAKGSVDNVFGHAVGTYYVYRTKDDEPCRHKTPFGDGTRCRRFHFEYFAKDYLPGERPTINVNVKKFSTGACSGPRETDEGDGDEGRRPR